MSNEFLIGPSYFDIYANVLGLYPRLNEKRSEIYLD